MSTDMKKDLHALRALLDTASDGANGYEQAMKSCDDASKHFQEYLASAHHGCVLAKQELESMLTSCGETPEEDGTLKAALHRGWVATRTAFSPNEEAAFAAEIVRGEEHAAKVYEDQLEKIKTPAFRTAIEGQLLGLRDNLTKAKAFSKHLSS